MHTTTRMESKALRLWVSLIHAAWCCVLGIYMQQHDTTFSPLPHDSVLHMPTVAYFAWDMLVAMTPWSKNRAYLVHHIASTVAIFAMQRSGALLNVRIWFLATELSTVFLNISEILVLYKHAARLVLVARTLFVITFTLIRCGLAPYYIIVYGRGWTALSLDGWMALIIMAALQPYWLVRIFISIMTR
jgi:hypothetical protein